MMDADHERWEQIVDRELLGDPLSEDDRQFRADFEAKHPECAKETAAWGDMIAKLASEERGGLADDALAASVLERAHPSAAADNVRPVRTQLFVGAAAVAAAAGIALVFSLGTEPAPSSPVAKTQVAVPSEPSAPAPVQPPSEPTAPQAEIVLASDAGAATVGEPLGSDGLAVESGRACIRYTEPFAIVCLDAGAKLRPIAATKPGELRLVLERGFAVASLDSLPEGHSFTIETKMGSVSAVGTVFSVAVTAEPAVHASVYEGVVRVKWDDHAQLLHRSESLALGTMKPVASPPLPDHWESIGDRDKWRGPADALAFASRPIAGEPAEARDRTVREGKPPTIAELQSSARKARSAGNTRAAARHYRELISSYPASKEAQVARVSLGDVLRKRGAHEQALAAYDDYLEKGGSLEVEARYGQIRALRSLGRKAKEGSAIDAFLTQFSSSIHAEELRARRSELR